MKLGFNPVHHHLSQLVVDTGKTSEQQGEEAYLYNRWRENFQLVPGRSYILSVLRVSLCILFCTLSLLIPIGSPSSE